MSFAQNSRSASGERTYSRICLIAIAVGLLLLGPSAALAQSIFASLSGTVVDANKAVVPGAKVDVQNAASGVLWRMKTNSNGFFSVAQLPVGTYNVSVEAKGFAKWKGAGISLQSGDEKSLTVALQVGSDTQTVTVNAGSEGMILTDSGARADHINTEDLEHLSLVGRNALEFLKILPGSAQITNSGTNRPAYTGETVGINGFTVNGSAGAMGGVSINGQAATGLSVNQDGQNVEDPGAPGSATPVNANPDMIAEVSVLTSNYGADNSKGPVVINSVSKSGGKQFHGDFHFYARNSAMNSEDSFNKAVESDPASGFSKGQLKVPSHYYYPGFDIGGPILIPGTGFNKARNKYFFEEGFESYRQLIDGGINRAFVPTAAMVNNGDFSGMSTWAHSPGRFGMSNQPSGNVSARPGCTINGGVLSPACISSAAQLWMKDSLPLPTSPDGAPNALGYNYISPVQESQNSTQNMVKFDADFTQNTKAYISWSRQRETADEPLGLWQGAGDWVIPSPSPDVSGNTSDLYTANLLHVFSPTLTVEARVGYSHMYMPGKPQNPSKVLRSQMNFPIKGVFGNPNAPVVTSWSQSVPNIGDIGHDYHPSFYAEKGIPSTGADLTKVYKTHTAKFGFFWEHLYNAQDAWSQYMGVYTYNPWSMVSGNNYADMLMGVGFNYFEQALPPIVQMAQNTTQFYATDHWQLNRRISVDYGMRFEHYGFPFPNDQWGAAIFDANKYQDGVQNSGVSWHSLNPSIAKAGGTGDPVVFSPRFGAVIDLYGNGKSVLRGGWGQNRYENYVAAYQGAANTALGSVSWGAPGTATTWESIDQFISDGSGSCPANAPGGIDAGNNHCAPKVVFGAPSNFTNSQLYVVDPHNHDQPYTTTYSLNFDQQFPEKFMFELAYVGNNSDLAQNGVNIDSVPVGAMTASAVMAKCNGMDPTLNQMLTDGNCQQKFRPYQNYQGVNVNESSGKAQYDSFQVSLTRSAALATLNFNYVWAKNLGTTVQSGAFKDYGTSEYWSPLSYDRAHTFNAAYVLDLPKLGLDNRFARGAVNGWEFSGITQIMSGALLTANSGYQLGISNAQSGALLVGSPDVTVAPILTCDPRLGLKPHQFANPSCFAQPQPGSQGLGNTRFPYIAGPMYWNSDATLDKKFSIAERQGLEMRFSAFNFMNHALTSFAPGDNNAKLLFDSTGKLTNATDTKDSCPGPFCQAFGYADYHYGQRILEVSAKYTF
jgi:hypothetical protein